MNTQTQTAAPLNASAPAECPECGGAKFYRFDVPREHDLFGKVIPCKTCNRRAYIRRAGISINESGITFADIETDGRPGAVAMLAAARQFIHNKRTGFLTVHGKYGNGKSTLLKALVNDCIAHDVDVLYITMTEIMAYARDAFNSEKAGDSDLGRITEIARTPVLIIDEVDKARLSEYAREVQTHLFDTRYRNADKLGTVVAWNGTFESLDMPWVRSRLSEYPIVSNMDRDMRPLLGGVTPAPEDPAEVRKAERRAAYNTGEQSFLRRQIRATMNRMEHK